MKSIVAALISSLALAAPAAAQERTYTIHNDGGSRIEFVSDAPLETMTGVSSHVTGDVIFDADNPSGASGAVRVRVASIRTGIDLRDEHLRGDGWLDAARFPDATFEITRVEGAAHLQPNREARVRVHGRFTIHGVTHDVVSNARVRLIPFSEELRAAHIDGDVLRVRASFAVRLTDYGVSVPLPVRLKVSNEIQVNVTLRAVAPQS